MAKKNPKKPQARTQPARKSPVGFYMILGGIGVAGAAALVLAGNGGAEAPANIPLSLADTEVEGSGAAGVTMGSEDAPVTIIEFADFLCPHCRTFNSVTGKVIRRNYASGEGAILRWVNYDFPLQQASWAPALAARCAEAQGAYWEVHDLLYARTEDWARESNPNGAFVDIAGDIGLDKGQFRECLAEGPQRTENLKAVSASRKYGESLGVGGTPTLYLNGRRLTVRTEADYATLEGLIREAAAAAVVDPAEAAPAEADSEG